MVANGGQAHRHHQVVLYDEEELEDSEKCGCELRCCGMCRTKRHVINCLGCCTNPKFILVFLSIVAFMQGFIVNGLVNISVSSLERRFHLQSQEVGLVASCYDIGSLCCLIFVTYIGGRSHKALWLGWGVFIMGCGSVVFSLPHFIAPKYSPDSNEHDLCKQSLSPTCGNIGLRAYRGFLLVGQLLHGIGASPFYTLGVTYMDENVKQVYSSTYHGIYYTFSILGPGAGYILGGQFLSIYTNIGETVTFTESSQLWVGAWWIGFLAAGIFTILISFPIQMFPFQFPGTEHVRENREREMYRDSVAEEVRQDEKFGSRLKDFPKSLWVIIRNPTLVCLSIAGAMESGLIAGVSTFGPKFSASIFRISASSASLAFGGLAVGAGVAGMFTGSIVVTKFQLKLPQMLKMCLVSAVISFGGLFVFLITCPNTDFAGGSVPYHTSATVGDISSQCNTECQCSLDFYNPVCGSDGISYYSSCFAGCTGYSGNTSDTNPLTICSCVMTATNMSQANATASYGICTQEKCANYGLYIGIMFISVTFTFFNSIPALQASIRSVPFSQRSFSVGVQWIFLRVLGSIPGPLIYGRVLDLTCLVWNEECGDQGSCKRYDNEKMSKYLLALALSYKAVAILMFFLALCLYKPRSKEDQESNSDANAIESNDTIDMAKKEDAGHPNPGFEDEDRTQL